MEFKLVVTPPNPAIGQLALEAETPLSGVSFVEAIGAALRKSIDHVARSKHTTLGALPSYEMSVPQAVAIDSGLFEDTTTARVVIEPNLLADFIWYSGSMSNEATHRPCYPYMTGGATLVSNIDELGFLQIWASLGYPKQIWHARKDANSEELGSSSPTAADYVTYDPSLNDSTTGGGAGGNDTDNDCPNYDPDKCEGCTNHGHRPPDRPAGGPPPHGCPYNPNRPPCPGPGPYPPPPPPIPPHHHHHGYDPAPGTVSIGNTFYDPCGKLSGSGNPHDRNTPFFV